MTSVWTTVNYLSTPKYQHSVLGTYHSDEASKVAERVPPPLFCSIQLTVLSLSKHGLQERRPHSSDGMRQLVQQLKSGDTKAKEPWVSGDPKRTPRTKVRRGSTRRQESADIFEESSGDQSSPRHVPRLSSRQGSTAGDVAPRDASVTLAQRVSGFSIRPRPSPEGCCVHASKRGHAKWCRYISTKKSLLNVCRERQDEYTHTCIK